MGNAPSQSSPDSRQRHDEPQTPPPKSPRRRESIAALSSNKATAFPSVTLESATASTSHYSSRSAAESARLSVQPPLHSRPHHSARDRARSITSTSTLQSTSQFTMGNQESKQAHDRKPSLPYRPPSTKPKAINVPISSDKPAAAEIHSPQQRPQPQQQPQHQREEPPFFDEHYNMNTSSAFSRPPRLPLPIEEELHTPGSPIISPADVSGPVGPIEPHEEIIGLPRRSSVLSSTTLDDDDLGDDLGSLEGGPHIPVPTLLEWREAGEKVYVTGTFAGWDRKFRLHKKYVPCSNQLSALHKSK